MSSVKSLLKTNFGSLEQHFAALAKIDRDIAGEHGEDSRLGKLHASRASRLDAIAAHCGTMSDVAGGLPEMQSQTQLVPFLTRQQPYLDRPAAKAAGADDLELSKLIPDFVHAIIPPVPQEIRAVTRNGQPPLDLSHVEPRFAHLVKVSDDE